MRREGAALGKVTARITNNLKSVQLQHQDTRPSAELARTGSAYERIQARLEEAGCRPVDRGSYLLAKCPVHDDRVASLAVYAKPGRIRIRCWAGCADVDVLAALGLGVGDLFDEPRVPHTVRPRPVTKPARLRPVKPEPARPASRPIVIAEYRYRHA